MSDPPSTPTTPLASSEVASIPKTKPRNAPKPSKDTRPALPPSTKLPPVSWIRNDYFLVNLLITAIDENTYLQRTIWPKPGDTSTAKRAAEAHRDAAMFTLASHSPFREVWKYKGAIERYGRATGNQVSTLKKDYAEAKEILGVTGGGLKSERELKPDSALIERWVEAKKTCPQFYRLKLLLGERTNVSSYTINDSSEDLDITALDPRGRRRGIEIIGFEEEEDNDPKGHLDLDAEHDLDIEEMDQTTASLSRDNREPPLIEFTRTLPTTRIRTEAQDESRSSRSLTPSSTQQHSSSSRKRHLTELQQIMTLAEGNQETKRRRAIEQEETKIMELKEETKRQKARNEVELRRLELQDARE